MLSRKIAVHVTASVRSAEDTMHLHDAVPAHRSLPNLSQCGRLVSARCRSSLTANKSKSTLDGGLKSNTPSTLVRTTRTRVVLAVQWDDFVVRLPVCRRKWGSDVTPIAQERKGAECG